MEELQVGLRVNLTSPACYGIITKVYPKQGIEVETTTGKKYWVDIYILTQYPGVYLQVD